MKYLCHKPNQAEIDAYLDALEIKCKQGWSFSVSKRHAGIGLQKSMYWLLQTDRYKQLAEKYKTPHPATLYKGATKYVRRKFD